MIQAIEPAKGNTRIPTVIATLTGAGIHFDAISDTSATITNTK
ncbi:hypothetical protein J2S92_001588 [Arthrobacter bambusae]|nr:hypothetical protein [Arthrobacter bambusae]MDQ0236041.1 hypothetical protein [Arthrobacter bambusae]